MDLKIPAKLRFLLALYSVILTFVGPFVLRTRLTNEKEDLRRVNERIGLSRSPRPDGEIIWTHAASVGECLAFLPLARALAKKGYYILITSQSLSSARLLERLLEKEDQHIFHQSIPLDSPVYVQPFLDYWRPAIAMWIESEIWPNTLILAKKTGIPLLLLNARMSEKSKRNWGKLPSLARLLLSYFDWVSVQEKSDIESFKAMGAGRVLDLGNLKFLDSSPPGERHRDPDINALGLAEVRKRKRFLAASTHPGEEDLILDLLPRLEGDPLCLIALRHPYRADEVAGLIKQRGLSYAQRSKGDCPSEDTNLFLIDTLGELNHYYAVTPLAFIGGSWNLGRGGHNPLEAIRKGCFPVLGPDQNNFESVSKGLLEEGLAQQVFNEEALLEALQAGLNRPGLGTRTRAKARAFLDRKQNVLEKHVREILRLIPKAGKR